MHPRLQPPPHNVLLKLPQYVQLPIETSLLESPLYHCWSSIATLIKTYEEYVLLIFP